MTDEPDTTRPMTPAEIDHCMKLVGELAAREIIKRLREQLAIRDKWIAELEHIVAKLPRFADRSIATVHMAAWHPAYKCNGWVSYAQRRGWFVFFSDERGRPGKQYFVHDCYPTPEAAEAGREKA